jgi:hypothetical protein
VELSMADESRIDEQFGFVNNLFIGLATGLSTYLFHLSFSADSAFSNWFERISVVFSAVLALLSLVLGSWLAWRRIDHFRMLSRHPNTRDEKRKESYINLLFSEKANRRLLKLQGATLFLALIPLFVLTVRGFICK